MTEHVTIKEIHKFKGKFPLIPTYPHVDEPGLLLGDTEPLFLNLPIAEMNKRSNNGIFYDEALVCSIAEQLQGTGGGRGHIPDGMEDSAFPLEEVFWVGHLLDDKGVLWAKGYVPPGRTREFIQRKKASGGEIATSIFGKAIKEMDTQKRAYRLRDLRMEYVDLAPAKRASLENKRGFELTKEMSEGETPMPEKADIIREFTVADIALLPQSIREAIVSDVKLRADATRVSELEQKNQKLETDIKEMREYASIVTTIRGVLPANADIAQVVTEMSNTISAIRSTLGENVNIVTTVEELHRNVAEMRTKEFSRNVSDKVAEFTKWNVTKDEDVKTVTQLRNSFQKRVEAEAKGDATKVAETAQRVWGDEFQLIAEQMVKNFGGPAAIVGGKSPASGGSVIDQLKSEAGIKAVNEKFGVK